MTTVALEGMKFYAYHGYYEEERKIGTEFILDVYVEVPRFDSSDDNIKDTVNYENIYKVCAHHMLKKQYKLLETIAYHIGEEIKGKYEQIASLKVKISKIGPQLGGVVDKALIVYEC